MLNLVLGSVAITSVIPTVRAGTPVLYGVCFTTCVSVCYVGGASAGIAAAASAVGVGIAAGLWAVVSSGSCVAVCVAACGPFVACLSSDTSIIVQTNGKSIQRPVKDIKAGDFVQTLKNTETYWTQVLGNTKVEGEIEFIRITAKNMQNTTQIRYVEVTPEHELVLSRANNLKTISSAKYIQMDDVLIDSIGNKLSVTALEKIILNEKHNLVTLDGTVLASDIFVTTMCNDDDGVAVERLFEPTMEDWRNKHSTLGELLPEEE